MSSKLTFELRDFGEHLVAIETPDGERRETWASEIECVRLLVRFFSAEAALAEEEFRSDCAPTPNPDERE